MLKDIIIWGLGGNGRNIIAVLKYIGIKAIVESNSEKVKLKEYEGIPLITPQEYFDKYTDNYLIVSMMDYEDVLKRLEKRGIKKYFLYTEREYTFYICLLIKNKEIEKVLGLNKKNSYCISHIDMVSVLFFDYLKDAGYDVTICDRKNRQIIEQLLSDVIVDKKNLITDTSNKYVLTPENVNNIILKEDRTRIRMFKDIHKGESVFIVATGPSLRIEDLEKIRESGHCSISMNSIYEVFSKTRWRPSYYVASDGTMVERMQNSEIDYLDNIQSFFSDNYIKCPNLRKRDNCFFFNQKQCRNRTSFSMDCSNVVYSGKTVSYACIQLAVYMGFKRLYLLGFDHSFSNDRKHFYNENKEAYNVKFFSYDIEYVEKAYKCAKEYAKNNGIVIQNISRNSKLDVFETGVIENIFR